MRVAVKIELSDADRQRLERLSRSRSAAVRLRERSRIVLMAAGGRTNKAIAAKLGIDQNQVGRWRRRYADEGLEGIAKERPRGGNHGGKNSKAQALLRREVIRLTTQSEAPDGTHWSCRSMARAAGTTHSFVHRVWRSCGLKPHLVRTFKVSTDPHFEEKLQDVVGLYLDPPDNAAVFSFDEKSSVQALDRTQPGLPLKKGRCGTMTHDYKRHGTTSLFVALEVASGEVIGQTYKRHRPPGGAEVPAQGGTGSSEGAADPPHPRQLRHPQARQGAEMDRAPAAGLPALHTDQLVVAELGRALLLHLDPEAEPPQRLPFRRPPREVPQAIHRDLQRKPETAGLDQVGGRNSAKGGTGQTGARHPFHIITVMIRTLH